MWASDGTPTGGDTRRSPLGMRCNASPPASRRAITATTWMRFMRRNCSCPTRGCPSSCRVDRCAILVIIESNLLMATTIGGLVLLATGAVIGWLATRPALARMQERLGSEASLRDALRDTFRALSDEALKSNNQAFLDLAETKMREVRATTAKEIDERKIAIENLLAPMAKTLGEVDREL